jgi:hypothetical protein
MSNAITRLVIAFDQAGAREGDLAPHRQARAAQTIRVGPDRRTKALHRA